MKCPICNVDLMMAERQGVEIDYCPQCRGVWLDRGELDKIIERTSAEYGERSSSHNAANDQPLTSEPPRREEHDRKEHDRDRHDDDRRGQGGSEKKRRGSFLGDILGGLGE
jgi:Zn-finger nucleic acid-binding protein